MSEATIRYKTGEITRFRSGDKLLISGREIKIVRMVRRKPQPLFFHGDWERSPVFVFFPMYVNKELAEVLMQIISFSSGLHFRRIFIEPNCHFSFELYKPKAVKTKRK